MLLITAHSMRTRCALNALLQLAKRPARHCTTCHRSLGNLSQACCLAVVQEITRRLTKQGSCGFCVSQYPALPHWQCNILLHQYGCHSASSWSCPTQCIVQVRVLLSSGGEYEEVVSNEGATGGRSSRWRWVDVSSWYIPCGGRCMCGACSWLADHSQQCPAEHGTSAAGTSSALAQCWCIEGW